MLGKGHLKSKQKFNGFSQTSEINASIIEQLFGDDNQDEDITFVLEYIIGDIIFNKINNIVIEEDEAQLQTMESMANMESMKQSGSNTTTTTTDNSDNNSEMKNTGKSKEKMTAYGITKQRINRDTTTEKVTTFEEKCVYFFNQILHSQGEFSNPQPNFLSFLAIYFLQRSIFCKIMHGCILGSTGHSTNGNANGNGKDNYLASLASKYCDLGLMDLCMVDYGGQSIFHLAARFDENELFNTLLIYDNQVFKYKTLLNETPFDIAMQHGNWIIVKTISLAKMGSKIKDMVKKIEKKIDLQRGIVEHILNHFNEKLMNEIVIQMVELIHKQLPISDDLLLACWKFETQNKNKSNNKNQKNRIWLAIKEKIRHVLDVSHKTDQNKIGKYWFDLYIAQSSIWYEVVDMFEVPTMRAVSSVNSTSSNNDNNVKTVQTTGPTRLNCKCGEPMIVVIARSVHADRKNHDDEHKSQELLCDGAQCSERSQRSRIDLYDLIYHCPKGSCKAHAKYDLCMSCGSNAIRMQQLRGQQQITTTTQTNNKADQSTSRTTTHNTNEIAYSKLVAIANDELVKQTEHLTDEINKTRSFDNVTFNKMLDYNEFLIDETQTRTFGLRQDNSNLLTFPNVPNVDVNKLTRLKMKNFYDSRIYLPNLIIVANALNDEFQHAVKNMVSSSSSIGQFQSGPVKTIERCQAKAESDYASMTFPTSSHIVDIVRCTLVFDTPQKLVYGLNTIKNKIEQQSNSQCIKKILRIKNGFLRNRMKIGGNISNWLYNYADVKFNVLIESSKNRMSLIGEIQFLLKLMVNDKKKRHKLYSITRQENFINDMYNIMKVSNGDKQQQLFFLVHSCKNASNSSRIKQLGQFLISYGKSVSLNKCDNRGMNSWHYCCKFNNFKMFKLFKSVTNSNTDNNNKTLREALTVECKNESKFCCIHFAMQNENSEMIDEITRISQQLGIQWQDNKNSQKNIEAILFEAVKKNKFSSLELLLRVWQTYLKDISFSSGEYNRTLLHCCGAVKTERDSEEEKENLKCFKLLLQQPGVDVNIVDDDFGPVMFYLIHREKMDHIKLFIEYGNQQDKAKVWKSPMADLKLQKNKYGDRNIIIAARYSRYEVMKYLFDNNLVANVNCQTGNEFDNRTSLIEIAASDFGYSSNGDNRENLDNFRCFTLLLDQQDIDINITDGNGNSVLYSLISHNKLAFIQYMVTKYDKDEKKLQFSKLKSVRNSEDDSMIVLAARYSSYDVLKYLLEENWVSDINQHCGRSRNTALSICSQTVHGYKLVTNKNKRENGEDDCDAFKCWKLLLSQPDIDINVQDDDGDTPFILSVKADKPQFVGFMIDNAIGWNSNADTNSSKYKWTLDNLRSQADLALGDAINVAAYFGLINVLTLLVSDKYFPKFRDIDHINKHENAFQGGYNALLTAVTTHFGFNARNPRQCNNYKIFELFLQLPGIDTTVKDKRGTDILTLLDVNGKSEYKDLVFKHATQSQLETIESYQIQRNQSDLFVAVRHSNYQALKHILENKLYQDINEKHPITGYSALGECATTQAKYYSNYNNKKHNPREDCDNLKCFKLLLAQPDIKVTTVCNTTAYTPFLDCVKNNKVEFVKFLIDNAKGFNKNNEIDESKDNIDIKYNWTLKEIVSQVNHFESNGMILAVWHGSYDVVKLFLSNKYFPKVFDIDNINNHRNTWGGGYNALLQCCDTPHGFDKDNPTDCDNYYIFEKLISLPGIDTNVKHPQRGNIRKLLKSEGRSEYLRLLNH